MLTRLKLIYRAELNAWIAAEFDWKVMSSKDFDGVDDIENDTPINQFDFDVALSKRCIPQLTDELVTKAAFLPKRYRVRLPRERIIWYNPKDQLLPAAPPPSHAIRALACLRPVTVSSAARIEESGWRTRCDEVLGISRLLWMAIPIY